MQKLEDNAVNAMAINIKKILDGKLECDTYNLRMCFYKNVIQDKEEIEKAIKEVEEKRKLRSPIIKDIIETFEIKLEIYERYLDLLEEREKGGTSSGSYS